MIHMHSEKKKETELRILHCVPVHENNDVIIDLINNINKFTKNSIIVLQPNLNFQTFDETIVEKYDNVYVNNKRFNYKIFGNQLNLLLSNFEFSQQFDYDYFSIFHSNQLYIKSGLEKYISDCDMTMEYFPQVSDRFKESEKLYPALSQIPVNERFNNHAEGTVYKKELFEKIYNFLKTETPLLIEKDIEALEETLLPTLAYKFANKDKILQTSLLFADSPDTNTLDALLQKNQQFNMYYGIVSNTDNIHSLKRVARSECGLRIKIRELNDV